MRHQLLYAKGVIIFFCHDKLLGSVRFQWGHLATDTDIHLLHTPLRLNVQKDLSSISILPSEKQPALYCEARPLL